MVLDLVPPAGALVLAGLLLRADFHDKAHRVFALFLALLAVPLLVLTVMRGAGVLPPTPAGGIPYPARALAYFILALPVVAASVPLFFPRPRTAVGRHRWGFACVLALMAVPVGLYALDHGLLHPPPPAASGAGGVVLPFAPLAPFVGAWPVVLGAVGAVLARDVRRLPEEPERVATWWVAAAFTTFAAFTVTGQLLQAAAQLSLLAQFGAGISRSVVAAVFLFPGASLIALLAAIGYGATARPDGKQARAAPGRGTLHPGPVVFLVLVAGAVVSGFFATPLRAGVPPVGLSEAAVVVASLLQAAWWMAFLAMLAQGLLRSRRRHRRHARALHHWAGPQGG